MNKKEEVGEDYNSLLENEWAKADFSLSSFSHKGYIVVFLPSDLVPLGIHLWLKPNINKHVDRDKDVYIVQVRQAKARSAETRA